MFFGKIKICVIILLSIICLCACSKHESKKIDMHYAEADIQEIINSDEMICTPKIEDIEMDKYPEQDFLYENLCFSVFRDMGYFDMYSIRFDYLSSILNEYPPQAVRTIENNGQKSMYFVYETDEETRVFVFFFENNGFQNSRGFPIIMKKSLNMEDFLDLKVGDSMDDVEKIDPITELFKENYELLSDQQYQTLFVNGREKVSTIHLAKDGIIRIDYYRASKGEYIIERIITDDGFTIPVLYGTQCYLIYPEDYVN